MPKYKITVERLPPALGKFHALQALQAIAPFDLDEVVDLYREIVHSLRQGVPAVVMAGVDWPKADAVFKAFSAGGIIASIGETDLEQPMVLDPRARTIYRVQR